jgi:hypothetical protein
MRTERGVRIGFFIRSTDYQHCECRRHIHDDLTITSLNSEISTASVYLALFVPVDTTDIAIYNVIASVADIEAAIHLLLAEASGRLSAGNPDNRARSATARPASSCGGVLRENTRTEYQEAKNNDCGSSHSFTP